MIAREAVRFLEQTAKPPFFFAVGFHKPHDPFVAPKRYFEMYPPQSIVLHRDPPDLTPAPPLHFGKAYKDAFDKFTDRERREFQRAYAAGSSFVDAQIGKVLEALERSRFAKNTIVVLLSDHGYHLGERGWWNKATLFEHTTRSPLIVAAPGMKAKGRGCSRIVEFIDIYPTLAELCGLKPPDDLDGRSFASLLDDPEGEGKPAAFTFSPRSDTGLSVRTARWRYTEWGGGAKYRELYDHESDPGETRNLAADPRFADVVKQHRKLIRERFDK
jgi:uncharacterized sulfatase